MCELLGLCFNKPVRPEISFRGFRHRAEGNPDGWGIARFEGPACQVFKEPNRADRSPLADFLRDYQLLESTIFIAHVREASKGGVALRNTHPFVRVFRQREVVLAHNGTLNLDEATLQEEYQPVGDTDSERLLCLLLTDMSQRCIGFEAYQAIEQLLQGYNEYGPMNVLLSEGEHLYAYTERKAYQPSEEDPKRPRNGLYVVRRETPFGKVSLVDEDWEIDLDEQKVADQHGVIIATRPLTTGQRENWTQLSPGRLTVFKSGRQVYPREPEA